MSTSVIQSLPFTNTSTPATDTSYHLQYEKKQKNVSRLLATLIVPTSTPATDPIASVKFRSEGSNTTVTIPSTAQPVIPPTASTTTKGPAIIYPTGAPLPFQKKAICYNATECATDSIHLITPLKRDWFMVFSSCSWIGGHTYRLQHYRISHIGTARHLLPEETSEIGEGTRPPKKLWHAGSHGEYGAIGPQNKWVEGRTSDRVIYCDWVVRIVNESVGNLLDSIVISPSVDRIFSIA